MTKNDYKQIIEEALESDVTKGTSKINSVYALINSDVNITKEDRQEIVLYQANIMIDALKQYRDNLTSESDIEEYNDNINKLLKTETKPDNKFKLN